jgi:amino acid permease
MARTWVELVLPLYSVFAVFVYFRPNALPLGFEETVGRTALIWLMWAGVAALTGILAISALFLTFYLLYSPFYLLNQLRRLGGPSKWVDKRELRFYVCCFLLLCVLAGLAVVNPTAAVVSFTILAGSAQVLWRVLI